MIGRFVPWTKPDELPLDEQNLVAALGTLPNGTIECLMGDGQPLSLPQNLSPEILVALATPAGGEVVDAGSLRRGIGVKTTIARRTTGAAAESESGSAEPSRPKLVKPTESANPKQITAKLRRLGLAMHNFLDKKGSVLPVGGDADAFPGEKRPNLSWRVHLLPFSTKSRCTNNFISTNRGTVHPIFRCSIRCRTSIGPSPAKPT